MTKPAAPEIRCDACNGTGSAPAHEPEPGRRIYPGRCKKCGGKGRILKSE
jgi:DnaJ-class molecular chaperone